MPPDYHSVRTRAAIARALLDEVERTRPPRFGIGLVEVAADSPSTDPRPRRNTMAMAADLGALQEYIALETREDGTLRAHCKNGHGSDAHRGRDAADRIKRAIAELFADHPECPCCVDGAIATLQVLISARQRDV